MSQSDSPCISNAQHSVRPDQSRCIYQVLPRQQDVFHPTGHDLLNGRPLPGTENRHQVGPHVLRHMPYLSEKGEAITSQPAAWNHVFCVSETSADTKHCRWTLHHWFHVKPTHEHGVGVMAERRRHPRGLHSQDR